MIGLIPALAYMIGAAAAEDAVLAASRSEQNSEISDSVSHPSSDTPKLDGIDREFRKDNKTLKTD